MTTAIMTYRGGFVNDKFHGKGMMKTLDGKTTYVGDFVAGLYHGIGKYTDSVMIYEGDFKNGMQNGYGHLISK